jgi:hypothetical protein
MIAFAYELYPVEASGRTVYKGSSTNQQTRIESGRNRARFDFEILLDCLQAYKHEGKTLDN